jgi:PAS domain S-box-containing protein
VSSPIHRRRRRHHETQAWGRAGEDSAINSATSGIAFADLDGRLTFANPSCLKMWGYDRETDVLGRPFASFLEFRAEGVAIHRSTLETGASAGEATARRRDGSTFIVQISTNPREGQSWKAPVPDGLAGRHHREQANPLRFWTASRRISPRFLTRRRWACCL